MSAQPRQGIFFLQECMFYNEFNFLRACLSADTYDKGSLSFDELFKVLKSTRYQFSDLHIEDIFADSPRTFHGEVKYKELNKKIEEMGMPKTYFSLIPSKLTTSRIEDIGKILDLQVSLNSLLKQEEMQNFGLGQVNLIALEEYEREKAKGYTLMSDTIELHNNRMLISNFPLYFSQAMLNSAIRGREGLSQSIKEEYLYKLLKKSQLEKFTNVKGLIWYDLDQI